MPGKAGDFSIWHFRDTPTADTAARIGRTGDGVLERVYCNFPRGRMSRNGPPPIREREREGPESARISPVPVRPGEGPLIEPKAGGQFGGGNCLHACFVTLDAPGDSGNRGDRPVRNCVMRSDRGYALGIGEGRR
jgi:hypothetical protein